MKERAAPPPAAPRMRIDKLLWFLRLAKTRSAAQALCEQGYMRLGGRRVDRAHLNVTAGDVLVIPVVQGVRVIEVTALPHRRGPASEAQSCYRVLDEPRELAIAAANRTHAAEGDLQP